MVINKEVKSLLTQNGIKVKDGIAYLLSVYFDVVPEYVPVALSQKIIKLKIFEWDVKTSTLRWNISLFSGEETKFDWVTQYRDAFRKRNPERGGTLSACVARMKKFFAENPEVRVEEVNHAVGMYFLSVRDNQYLISAHKFIYSQSGAMKTSPLEEWIEKYREIAQEVDERTSLNNTLQ